MPNLHEFDFKPIIEASSEDSKQSAAGLSYSPGGERRKELASRSLVEDIKNRIEIQQVFGHCFPAHRLVKRGRRWWTCCPLHGEKHPSFCLDPVRQRFNCFGCQAHGDVIDLYALGRGLSNQEAIKGLAARLQLRTERTPEERQAARAAREARRLKKALNHDMEEMIKAARRDCWEIEGWIHTVRKHIRTEQDLDRPGPIWALQNQTYIEYLGGLFLGEPTQQLEAARLLRRWQAWQTTGPRL